VFETVVRRNVIGTSLTMMLALVALLMPTAASARPGEVTRFPLPAGSEPQGIAVGPEGNLWFANTGSNAIGRVTISGEVREYPLPIPASRPFQITAGPDGNLWFTESGAQRIGRISPAGQITEFPIPEGGCCRTWGITAGPDGNVWFTVADMFGAVGRVSPDGSMTLFRLGAEGRGIVAGPDGNLWVAAVGYVREEPTVGFIARVTPDGSITRFGMPAPHAAMRPSAIATGPEGMLWFVGDGIGRVDTEGRVTVLDVPVPGELDGIVAGPDGNLWFGTAGPSPRGAGVGRVTPTGLTSLFPVAYGSRGVAVGPEGDIWFTEWAGHAVGRIVPGLAGLEISTWRAAVRRGRTRLPIACSGGPAGSHCRGQVSLVRTVGRRAPDGSRLPPRTIVLARASYDLVSGRRGSVRMRLSRRGRALLRRNQSVFEAVARATSGQGARQGLSLVPLARNPA
jgi:streptogramin lyase